MVLVLRLYSRVEKSVPSHNLKAENQRRAGFGEGDLKLIDFGFCKHFTPGKLMKSTLCSHRFTGSSDWTHVCVSWYVRIGSR